MTCAQWNVVIANIFELEANCSTKDAISGQEEISPCYI